MIPKLLLPKLSAYEDIALLAFRLFVGAFLVWGVWDNIVSNERMAEFAGFLKSHGFGNPHIMARLSAYAQFACGMGFILGFHTRWAGLLCAINFIVALVMVDGPAGIRPAFPAAMLVAFGLYVAARGGGFYSIDRMFASPAASDP